MILYQQNKLASLGQMISYIAHQWRQPLAEISMLENYILVKIDNSSLTLEEMKIKIKQEQEIVKFMSTTIDTFEKFYKNENTNEKFKVYNSIDNVKSIIKELLHLNQISFEENIKDKEISLFGNSNALSQVILSIIQNSIYFLQSREIKNPKISITLQQIDKNIKIIIKDNAKGINEDIIDKVFDYNISKRDNKNPSTGLGLYMSKLIVIEKFNGLIEAKNDKYGAIFTIILPI